MDAAHFGTLTTIDPTDLGRRVKAARLGKRLTQSELAHRLKDGGVSTAYISRIESGQRRPNGDVLSRLADQLDTTMDQLLHGITAREIDEIRLALNYAELSLESGQPAEAETHARKAREAAGEASLLEQQGQASFLLARAQEAQGCLDDAILTLEPLVAGDVGWDLRLTAGIALTRCYRDGGEYGRAVDIAEHLLGEIVQTPLAECDEAIQLTVTLASAHHERGDTGHAVRLCRKAVDQAERAASPVARASAYWNASMLESERGNVKDAVTLAGRALALLGEQGKDPRNLARLRSELGLLQLKLDPPSLTEARHQLTLGTEAMAWSSASTVDRARNHLALAQIDYLESDPETALNTCRAVYETIRDQVPGLAARAKTIEGQILATGGQPEIAVAAYRTAAAHLTGLGADRGVADQWLELAGLLRGLGEHELACDAYASGAAAGGHAVLSPPMPVPRVEPTAAQRATEPQPT